MRYLKSSEVVQLLCEDIFKLLTTNNSFHISQVLCSIWICTYSNVSLLRCFCHFWSLKDLDLNPLSLYGHDSAYHKKNCIKVSKWKHNFSFWVNYPLNFCWSFELFFNCQLLGKIWYYTVWRCYLTHVLKTIICLNNVCLAKGICELNFICWALVQVSSLSQQGQ